MRAYAPWAQVKEQKAAKAKPDEQEKGTKAKKLKPKVPRIMGYTSVPQPGTDQNPKLPTRSPTPEQSPSSSLVPTVGPLSLTLTTPPDLAPQSVPLELKSKPTIYDDSCGAESVAPLKRRSVKATTHLSSSGSLHQHNLKNRYTSQSNRPKRRAPACNHMSKCTCTCTTCRNVMLLQAKREVTGALVRSGQARLITSRRISCSPVPCTRNTPAMDTG